MEEFLEFIAKHLVDHVDEVIPVVEEENEKLMFKLKVNEDDVGKIIGRNSRTASALRTLLRAVAAKEEKRAALEIIG